MSNGRWVNGQWNETHQERRVEMPTTEQQYANSDNARLTEAIADRKARGARLTVQEDLYNQPDDDDDVYADADEDLEEWEQPSGVVDENGEHILMGESDINRIIYATSRRANQGGFGEILSDQEFANACDREVNLRVSGGAAQDLGLYMRVIDEMSETREDIHSYRRQMDHSRDIEDIKTMRQEGAEALSQQKRGED